MNIRRRHNPVYRNKQVVVRVGKLLRKPQRNPKAKGQGVMERIYLTKDEKRALAFGGISRKNQRSLAL